MTSTSAALQERTAQPGPSRRVYVKRIGSQIADHRSLSIVVGLYVLAALVLPTRSNVAILDDFVYIRQAQAFANHLYVHVPDQVAANAVFEIFWGGLFGMLLGTQLWIFRLSTLVLSVAGGLGLYALCREVGVGRNGSVCASALLLFNPVFFVLSYSFMTDPHLVSLIVLATWCYVRGLREPRSAGWTWAGSVLTGLAYLSRPQGALVAVAVVVWMLLERRMRFDRRSFVQLARIAAIPTAVIVVHRLWLQLSNGLPATQNAFLHNGRSASIHDVVLLGTRLTFVEVMYLGLFIAPIAVGVLTTISSIARRLSHVGWACFAGWVGIVVVGMWYFQGSERRMPYIASWFTASGLGPDDIVGGRPPILQPWMHDELTWGSAAAALILGFVVIRALTDRHAPGRAGATLTGAVLVAMVLGAVPPSTSFLRLVSFDRYILPIVPFAIVLAVWACRGLHVWRVGVVAGVSALSLFSMVATRDFLEYEGAVWKLDRYANSIGVSNTKLDGGAGWTRYYLAGRGPRVKPLPGAITNWWITADHRSTAQYVVSGAVISGYEIIHEEHYSQWLQTGSSRMYLLKLPGNGAALSGHESSTPSP